MKKIIASILGAFVCSVALATTLSPIQLLNPAGSASGQTIVSTGVSSAPAWGNISATSLANIAANTVLGNATGSPSNVSAITVTGCNGAAQALQWTNGTGFGCNSSIATSGANANITSLSGLTTALSVPQGGSGRTTLTTHGVLVGEGTAAITQLAVGTTGQVLVGTTGADPAFGSSVGALTFTGAITPSSTAGIVGTTTNDNANAGSVGEFPTPSDLSSVPLTSGTAANGSSISLTAGDWDVSGSCLFTSTASTTSTIWTCGISTTSATRPASFSQENVRQLSAGQTNVGEQMSTPIVRISIATTTTVYLVGMGVFSVSTETLSGKMRARRIR